MLRGYPKYLRDCLFVSDEWSRNFDTLRGIQWATVELGFAETRGKEFSPFAVS